MYQCVCYIVSTLLEAYIVFLKILICYESMDFYQCLMYQKRLNNRFTLHYMYISHIFWVHTKLWICFNYKTCMITSLFSNIHIIVLFRFLKFTKKVCIYIIHVPKFYSFKHFKEMMNTTLFTSLFFKYFNVNKFGILTTIWLFQDALEVQMLFCCWYTSVHHWPSCRTLDGQMWNPIFIIMTCYLDVHLLVYINA